jgi:hypothetical protein
MGKFSDTKEKNLRDKQKCKIKTENSQTQQSKIKMGKFSDTKEKNLYSFLPENFLS